MFYGQEVRVAASTYFSVSIEIRKFLAEKNIEALSLRLLYIIRVNNKMVRLDVEWQMKFGRGQKSICGKTRERGQQCIFD